MKLLRGNELEKQQVIQLLDLCELPVDDITDQLLENFIGVQISNAQSQPLLAGVIGLEIIGTIGLLRSLAVDPAQRGYRWGDVLTTAIENRAQQDEIQNIYLLTTTAENYFSTRGYHFVDRADVPDVIKRTTQFSELCPASATVMCKAI